MKRKTPHRYTDGELFLCTGGVFGPKQVEVDPESLKGENLKLSNWFWKLPQDGSFRFRAGSLGGKLWAEISIEFLNFCDDVVPWSYICTAPTTEAGKVIKRVDRRPEVTLYWNHLANVVKATGATMEVMHEEPYNGVSWIMAPLPFVDLDHAMASLAKEQKAHPRQVCTIEKYDRTGQLVVAIHERDNGRMQRQVDISIPIRPFATRAQIKVILNGFLDRLGAAPGVTPAEHLTVAKGMHWTLVNVI
jgi:hypothetical protein